MVNPNNLRIIITGANGYVATNVRNYFNSKKIKLFGIARRDFHNYNNETKLISQNLNESNIISKLKNCHALLHLIGIGKQTIDSDYEETNVSLTQKAIKLCKNTGIKKLIYISGFGISKKTNLNYFISKNKAENEIIQSGLDYTIFRASYIVGKNDPLSKKINKQIKRGIITIPGSGKYHIQPISVNDVVKILLSAVTSKNFSNKIIDLVGPKSYSFEEYVKIFSRNYKIKIKKKNFETVFRDALLNPNSIYGIDDLSILVGNFKGNYKKLKKIYDFEFQNIEDVL